MISPFPPLNPLKKQKKNMHNVQPLGEEQLQHPPPYRLRPPPCMAAGEGDTVAALQQQRPSKALEGEDHLEPCRGFIDSKP